MEGGELLKVS